METTKTFFILMDLVGVTLRVIALNGSVLPLPPVQSLVHLRVGSLLSVAHST